MQFLTNFSPNSRSQTGLRAKLLEPMPPMEKDRLTDATSPTTAMPMVRQKIKRAMKLCFTKASQYAYLDLLVI